MTRKKMLLTLLASFLGSLVIAGYATVTLAAAPNITIGLSFDKNHYSPTEPIVVEATVYNGAGDILISEGFMARTYYLDLRLVNPAGFQVKALRQDLHKTGGDRPPLPFDQTEEGAFIEIAPCELMAAGWSAPSAQTHTANLRDFYKLDLAGWYSARVQVSAMTWGATSFCDVNSYGWLGVLESNTVYFYVEGKQTASVTTIIPSTWPLAWRDVAYLPNLLEVRLAPPTGGSLSDYVGGTITLNAVPNEGVANMTTYLSVKFSEHKSILSLGENPTPGTYPVIIAGRYQNGETFSGTSQVKVVSPYGYLGFFSPVDNPPALNVAKAGQAVPVKWQISGGIGLPAVDSATSFKSFTSYQVSCTDINAGVSSTVEEYASGTSGLQYLGGGNWQYNWKVPKSYAGQCRKMVITLADEMIYTAYFQFK